MNKQIKMTLKDTATYQLYVLISKQINEFLNTIGMIGKQLYISLLYIIKMQINIKQVVVQSSRFGFDSLPITIAIVSMTTVIISMQVAPEMVKQGGENYVGMLIAMVMVRELADIMAGFAIISMIGSAFASEIATMKVTEQIDAMNSLKVDPIKYLFVPRLLAGFIMMPFVVIIDSFIGLVFGGITATSLASISTLNYIESIWHGLVVKDIFIALLKASVFGFAIVLVSLSCGLNASGGAKGVGIATTRAVVWSFITITIIDYIFALIFYF